VRPRPIVLATCRRWPELSASDRRLADALQARGWTIASAPWNGAFEPFAEARAVVLRSTWDYHEAPAAYLAWLERLPPRCTFNAPELVRWNLSKRYLLDLAGRGAPLPRTREAAADPAAIAGALDALNVQDAVLKPVVGASGFGVERVRRGDEARALTRLRAHKCTEHVLVQEFVAGIEAGEVCGVFFDGAFCHALRRLPAPGEFRVNSQFGGRMEAATLPAEVVARMRAVLALLPSVPVYARVDGVVHGRDLVLMEVELNEPALGLELAPLAAERFADALVRRLEVTPGGTAARCCPTAPSASSPR
jgi:glutathione synthase/RimK-type ligase-like ATP-grasp enzyme